MFRAMLLPLMVTLLLIGAGGPAAGPARGQGADSLRYEGETHLRNIRQLTFGGENAEAYWSWDQTRIIFQSTHPPYDCDQIFTMKPDGSDVQLASTGKGRTTCSFFMKGDERILYASTHHHMEDCPPPADFSKGYVWKLYPEFDLFTAKADGSDLEQLTDDWGYDAEAVVGPDGRIVYTSGRSGDLDIWVMDPDGGNKFQLTDRLGYDGGPWWSPDGSLIVWRAYYPETEAEIEHYQQLMAEHAISPLSLQLWVMKADGSDKRQITHNTSANFGPFFHPDGKRIIYCSNQGDPGGRNFDLWMIGVDGAGNEQITFGPSFDGFPMWSADGRRLIFASNRNNAQPRDTNIFLADWVE
jgi:dipeptidyl aminopeptidase/acylaminoacyl peptidase